MARCQLGEAQIHFYELCFCGLLCHHRLPAVETPTLHMSVAVRMNRPLLSSWNGMVLTASLVFKQMVNQSAIPAAQDVIAQVMRFNYKLYWLSIALLYTVVYTTRVTQ